MKRRHAKRPPTANLPADLTAALDRLGRLATASGGTPLLLAGPEPATVDRQARTISGLVVPYGPAGETSGGRLTFSRGSLRISDPRRVKLLREHDQRGDVIGHGVSFEETDAGLVGTFSVPATEAGDAALTEASHGLRDAFSVGVQLDDTTLQRLRRSQGAAVAGAGQLREVSLVSVPAFDDARLAASGQLVVSSWTTDTTTTTTTTGGTMFTEAQRRRLAWLLAQTSPTSAQLAERNQLQQLAAAAGVVVTASAPTEPEPAQPGQQQPQTPPTPAPPTSEPAPGQPVEPQVVPTEPNGNGFQTASLPGVVPAGAGAAYVVSQPATYDFSTPGTSLVADLYNAGIRHDSQAWERVERFNAELRDHNAPSVNALVTAAATRDNIDGAGTDLPSAFQPSPYRADLMRQLVDVGRPFISRLDRVPLTNAQPFAIPVVGEFTGVGPHVEGTPHRPAGTLTLGVGDTVQPTATSGAWEASRELIDAATPVLDRIAMRAMLRDYQRQTEAKWIALFRAVADAGESTVYGINGPLALRGAMLDFVNDDEEAADMVGVSKGLLRVLGLDVDGMDRPQLPFVGPVNAQGTMRAGYTGVAIDGVEVFRAARLDAGMGDVGGAAGVLARKAGLLWGESSVLQFRFDEVLGPGVIKLALWAYTAAAVLDTDDVAILRAGADPAP